MYNLNEGYYLSERVIDAEKFCLRLLLMCCSDLSCDEVFALMQDGSQPVNLEDVDDEEHQILKDPNIADPLTDPSVTATAAGPVTPSLMILKGGPKTHDVAYGTFGYE